MTMHKANQAAAVSMTTLVEFNGLQQKHLSLVHLSSGHLQFS